MPRIAMRELHPLFEPASDGRTVLDRVVAFYHDTLKASPEAWAYLERRGLSSEELVDRFRLGYANRTLGLHLPPKRLKAGGELRSRLQRLGVFRETGHENLAGSLVVPILDRRGKVLGLYGRKIRDDLRKGTARHLYVPESHGSLWNEASLEGSEEVILAEGLLDGLTFWAAGHRNVTAIRDPDAFTSEHLAAFRRRGVRRVLIAFDRDDAGDAAAEVVAKELVAAGLECYRVLFPRDTDANAYAVEFGSPAMSLGVLLRAATWVGGGAGPRQTGPSTESLSASPVPPLPTSPELPLAVEGRDLVATVDGRRYRVRGLDRNPSPEVLRVNLLVTTGVPDGSEAALHVDTLDLYQARQRAAFAQQAAAELGVAKGVLRRDLARLLLALEGLQETRIREALEPGTDTVSQLTEAERTEALDLLTDPRLLDRILADFDRAGVVGEETNKLLGYLATVSRKLEEPLAVILQSSTAAGKTSLMDGALAFVPPEDRVQYSALTSQSLFYMERGKLRHRVLAVVEEEGAERASYALKLLQSEGELTIASTGKDPDTGRLVTHEYRTEGPVMLFLTTTAVEVDEELLNRALVLAVDEDPAQTRRVHRRQREKRTLDGLLARRGKERVLRLHQNAQRLLRPLAVVNPYAPRLTFLDTRTRTRRDHEKYLTLIDAVALLHQHQREIKRVERVGEVIKYVEVTPSNIEVANRLAGEVLGRSLDELPPQTRRVLSLLDAWVEGRCSEEGCDRSDLRFSARDVREALGLGPTQTRVHLWRLVELEYLALHRGGPGRRHVYELLYQGEGDEGRPFLPGLLDPDALTYDGDRAGPGAHRAAPGDRLSGGARPPSGPRSGGSRGAPNGPEAFQDGASGGPAPESGENAPIEEEAPSHVPADRNGGRP